MEQIIQTLIQFNETFHQFENNLAAILDAPLADINVNLKINIELLLQGRDYLNRLIELHQ